MPVVRVYLFSDGVRLLIEVWDQATGFPALRRPASDAEAGRGLHLVDALTGGRWGWQPGLRLYVRWGRAGEAPGQLRLVARVEGLRLA
jgi:hypothetical protein